METTKTPPTADMAKVFAWKFIDDNPESRLWFLTGSVAFGEAGPDSDIDIVVTPEVASAVLEKLCNGHVSVHECGYVNDQARFKGRSYKFTCIMQNGCTPVFNLIDIGADGGFGFEVWRIATEMYKTLPGKAISKEHRVETFKSLCEQATKWLDARANLPVEPVPR